MGFQRCEGTCPPSIGREDCHKIFTKINFRWLQMQGMTRDMEPEQQQEKEKGVTFGDTPFIPAGEEQELKILQAGGATKEDLHEHLKRYRPSVSHAMVEGGTVLGSLFVMATPIVQMIAHTTGNGVAPSWKSFKAVAPKAAGLGLALGAIGNGALAVRDMMNWQQVVTELNNKWDATTHRSR